MSESRIKMEFARSFVSLLESCLLILIKTLILKDEKFCFNTKLFH